MPDLVPSRIRQIAVVCKDVARARDFYRDVIGLPHLFDAGPNLSFFDCGGVRLMLSPAEGEAAGTSVIYYLVNDITASMNALKEKGAAFVDEPHMIARMPDHELWMAFFRDPDRNLLALMCEVK